jgi:hypothetical protein
VEWSGTYTSLRDDYVLNAKFDGARETVDGGVCGNLPSAGGQGRNYLGLELKYVWSRRHAVRAAWDLQSPHSNLCTSRFDFRGCGPRL